MLCPNCKTINQEASNFCNHCGEPLKKRAPVETDSGAPLKERVPVETGSSAPLKKRAPVETGIGKWIVVFMGLLILAAGWAYFFQDVDPSTKSSNKTVLPNSSLSSPLPPSRPNSSHHCPRPTNPACWASPGGGRRSPCRNPPSPHTTAIRS